MKLIHKLPLLIHRHTPVLISRRNPPVPSHQLNLLQSKFLLIEPVRNHTLPDSLWVQVPVWEKPFEGRNKVIDIVHIMLAIYSSNRRVSLRLRQPRRWDYSMRWSKGLRQDNHSAWGPY
jgi:hypothetical protein